jgi:uncharacterized membrane protein HdeD (DUF308 family)
VTATRYSRNQSIHSLSSLIRIRILLEGAASAIYALSNKTHIWKGFLLGFYPLPVLFVFFKVTEVATTVLLYWLPGYVWKSDAVCSTKTW